MTAPNQDGAKTDGRDAAGRFAIGNKGSPGRPPGRGAVAEMRERLATDIDAIINTLKAKALSGDAQAIRIILDRVLPVLRPVELPTPLLLTADGTLADHAHAVVRSAAEGDLAPGQAAQLVAALSAVARIIETTDLIARIEALENDHAKP